MSIRALDGGGTAAVTPMVRVPLKPPAVAVIVALPTAMPVTTPVEAPTVATALLFDDQRKIAATAVPAEF